MKALCSRRMPLTVLTAAILLKPIHMTDHFTLAPFEFFAHPTRTRFPFRYGIASMTDVPHLFARTTVSVSTVAAGLSAEGLPPKWFTKDPRTSFEQDLPEMLRVIQHAAKCAERIGATPTSYFDFWSELNREQSEWAVRGQVPPLLANLGVSLIERAVLDGLCRATGQPLHRMVLSNRLGLRLGEIYSELKGSNPADLLPARPLAACSVRHTIGLGDPLSPGDIPAGERVDDGLPQDLESSIRAYGLRYFKIKLWADPDRDLARLRDLSRILAKETGGDFWATVDGNENFKSFESFREFWQRAMREPDLGEFPHRILVVEQPIHRDRALGDDLGEAMRAWTDRPPFIIDESDGAIGDLPRALSLGYAGTSHKNCKGIVKGIANACLLAARRRVGEQGVLTGEDLCNLGPVALLQDLASMALLGIEHVERNGHHYYRGLSMWPAEWQAAVLSTHNDLYSAHVEGFPRLKIGSGQITLASVNSAPFGVQPVFDPARFSARLQMSSYE